MSSGKDILNLRFYSQAILNSDYCFIFATFAPLREISSSPILPILLIRLSADS